MISQEELDVKMHHMVQQAPGKKGLLAKYIWNLLKKLFLGIVYQIISEEYEKWNEENNLLASNYPAKWPPPLKDHE